MHRGTVKPRTRRGMVGALAALGGSAAAVALAGCGMQSTATPAPSTVKLSGSISFWQWGKTYVDGFDKLTAEFNDTMDGAQVAATNPPGYDDKIKISLAAGSGGPDVYLMRGPNHKQWAHDGLAIDVSDYASRDKAATANLKVTQKTFYDYYHYQGKLFGVPWDFSTIAVAYNLDKLEARGLKPPAALGAGWDWNTFTEYAKKLTPGDGTSYGVDANPGIETGYYSWVVANGANFWSADYTTSTVDAPQFAEAVDAYMTLANRLQVSPPRTWLADKMKGLPHRSNALTTGLTAMQTIGDWYFSWFDNTPNFRWDVAPVPYDPHTRKTGSIANFRGLVISPQCENRDLAWAWVAHLVTRGVQDRIPSLMGEVPARLDSIDQVYLNPAKSPSPKSRQLLKASIAATQPLPGNPSLAWRDVSGAAAVLNDVYDGKRPARDALADLHQQLTALLGQ